MQQGKGRNLPQPLLHVVLWEREKGSQKERETGLQPQSDSATSSIPLFLLFHNQMSANVVLELEQWTGSRGQDQEKVTLQKERFIRKGEAVGHFAGRDVHSLTIVRPADSSTRPYYSKLVSLLLLTPEATGPAATKQTRPLHIGDQPSLV